MLLIDIGIDSRHAVESLDQARKADRLPPWTNTRLQFEDENVLAHDKRTEGRNEAVVGSEECRFGPARVMVLVIRGSD